MATWGSVLIREGKCYLDILGILSARFGWKFLQLQHQPQEGSTLRRSGAGRGGKKLERPYCFQKKVHEEQAFFNDSIAEHISNADLQLLRAARLLADGPVKTALEKAKLSLKGGKDALAHRQKLIRVTDRSELGWAVVSEYEADSLAVDSDDE